MEELVPIRTIKANFGMPLQLSCASSVAFISSLSNEVADCEDNPYDVSMADTLVWDASLTEEQRKIADELTAKKDAAQKAYDETENKENSPEEQAFFKAYEDLEKFISSTGRHLCFQCSYYLPKQLESGKWTAACTRTKKLTRPYSISCECYTTSDTPEMTAAKKKFAETCRKKPGFADFVHKQEKAINAQRFANQIKTEPATAFYLYKSMPDYHEKMYEEFPFIMAQTQYPSLPLFLEAYKRWEKDCIVKNGRVKDGMEGVTLSISQDEFRPKGKVVPTTIAETSNN